ncbi:MAG TPA: ComF family protein [Flavobacteriaceae bacterium]|nr:ComF family protein [Flavobacteriaceae bacterium]|tara:strand:+ start:7667 stop:8365 length:699 start_codon:yes stop_codon:yes gene_type:complete
MKNSLTHWWGSLLSFFFPRFCPGCSSELLPYETPACLHCQTTLPFTHFEHVHNNPIYEKLSQWTPLEEACSIFYFEADSLLQRLVYELKFKKQQQIGYWLGILAGQKLLQTPYEQCTALVSLPLHPKRQRQRGYNQVHLFCRALAATLSMPYTPSVIRRIKNTRQLSLNTTKDRFHEMDQAFEMNSSSVPCMPHWLLVDDIITTGATLQSCGHTLLETPGSKLSIVTLGCRM